MSIRKPLFDRRILKREVESFLSTQQFPKEKIEIVREWWDKIQRGHLFGYSETQVEQAFNNAIWVDVLGYQPIGKSGTHHIVPKRSASRKNIPDFVLGTFNPGTKTERWRAVGEIKSLHVNLDVPQMSRYRRETPVQQAFRYAQTGMVDVEWVIVTNFKEIRLYRNGYISSYHSWRLEELCKHETFAEFYLLLRRESVAPDLGEPNILRILNATLNADLALTEGFYNLYTLARLDLISALRELPAFQKTSESALFGKAHKLLNRILFAAFCEDHRAFLLPPNTIKAIHERARSTGLQGAYSSEFAKFFQELDKGSPPGSPNGFNAFNGGLFEPDPLLDPIQLPDRLFTKTFQFKQRGIRSREIPGVFGFYVYDFSEELDVDALGVIFEQSLKDFPLQEKAIRGHSTKEVTKRRTKGVFYTPHEITRYLVDRGLDTILTQIQEKSKSVASTKKLLKRIRRLTAEQRRNLIFLQDLMEHLKIVKVMDPACGSGNFLVTAFERLHEEYEDINSAIGELAGAKPIFGLDRLILRNNLHGIDVLPESVEITKLSIWLRTASSTEPLEKLDKTILSADTLRLKPQGTIDLIVSNPPWGGELPNWSDSDIKVSFPNCGEEKDTYALFVIQGYRFLKPGGVLSFIIPNSWLTVDGYSDFRHWILKSFDIVEIVNVWKVFRDVNHDACLLIARKRDDDANENISSLKPTIVRSLRRGISEKHKWEHIAKGSWAYSFECDDRAWLKEPGYRFETVYPPRVVAELSRLASKLPTLGECYDSTVGIQVYHRRKVPVSVIRDKAFHSKYRKGKNWYPFITGNEVQRYYEVASCASFLFYSDQLCDKRELSHYIEPRILIQQIFWGRLSASFTAPKEPILYLNTVFSITRPKSGYNLFSLLALLNSRFISATYERWTNRLFGDKFPKVSKLDIARIPVPMFNNTSFEQLSELGQRLTSEWQGLKSEVTSFQDFLSVKDTSGRLSKKMARFWEIERDEVLKLLAEILPNASQNTIEEVFRSWKSCLDKSYRRWSIITEMEENVENLVRKAYGVNQEIYEEIVNRVPSVELDQVLLPR